MSTWLAAARVLLKPVRALCRSKETYHVGKLRHSHSLVGSNSVSDLGTDLTLSKSTRDCELFVLSWDDFCVLCLLRHKGAGGSL